MSGAPRRTEADHARRRVLADAAAGRGPDWYNPPPARRTVRCGTCRGYYAEGELHTCTPKRKQSGGGGR